MIIAIESRVSSVWLVVTTVAKPLLLLLLLWWLLLVVRIRLISCITSIMMLIVLHLWLPLKWLITVIWIVETTLSILLIIIGIPLLPFLCIMIFIYIRKKKQKRNIKKMNPNCLQLISYCYICSPAYKHFTAVIKPISFFYSLFIFFAFISSFRKKKSNLMSAKKKERMKKKNTMWGISMPSHFDNNNTLDCVCTFTISSDTRAFLVALNCHFLYFVSLPYAYFA